MRNLKITCDCCGKNISEEEVYRVDHYIHVCPSFNRLKSHMKMVDGKMHPFSGRIVSKEFCLVCYNMLFDAFFNTLKNYKS